MKMKKSKLKKIIKEEIIKEKRSKDSFKDSEGNVVKVGDFVKIDSTISPTGDKTKARIAAILKGKVAYEAFKNNKPHIRTVRRISLVKSKMKKV